MAYVKPVAYIGGAWIMFEIAKAMWWELKINSHNNRLLSAGGVMSEEDTEEKEQIKGYLDNHYGSQLMNKLSAQNIMEEQVRNQLQMKRALQAKLIEAGAGNDSDNLNKVNDDIAKLQQVYSQLQAQRKLETNFDYPREK
jgi:hypothetical protein